MSKSPRISLASFFPVPMSILGVLGVQATIPRYSDSIDIPPDSKTGKSHWIYLMSSIGTRCHERGALVSGQWGREVTHGDIRVLRS